MFDDDYDYEQRLFDAAEERRYLDAQYAEYLADREAEYYAQMRCEYAGGCTLVRDNPQCVICDRVPEDPT